LRHETFQTIEGSWLLLVLGVAQSVTKEDTFFW